MRASELLMEQPEDKPGESLSAAEQAEDRECEEQRIIHEAEYADELALEMALERALELRND